MLQQTAHEYIELKKKSIKLINEMESIYDTSMDEYLDTNIALMEVEDKLLREAIDHIQPWQTNHEKLMKLISKAYTSLTHRDKAIKIILQTI